MKQIFSKKGFLVFFFSIILFYGFRSTFIENHYAHCRSLGLHPGSECSVTRDATHVISTIVSPQAGVNSEVGTCVLTLITVFLLFVAFFCGNGFVGNVSTFMGLLLSSTLVGFISSLPQERIMTHDQYCMMTGESGHDRIRGMATTKDGGFVTCGSSYSGPGPWKNFVRKYDRHANSTWRFSFSELFFGASKVVRSCVQLTDSGIVAIGDRFVGKYDIETGNLTWANIVQAVTGDYISSEFQRAIRPASPEDGVIVIGNVKHYVGGYWEKSRLLVAKFKDDGTLVKWYESDRNNRGESYINDYGRSIFVTDDGGFIVSGYSSHYDQSDSKGALVVKFTSNMTIEFAYQFVDPEGPSCIYAPFPRAEFNRVKQVSDGGYILLGHCCDRPMVMKLSRKGSVEWIRKFHSFGGDIDIVEHINPESGDPVFLISGYLRDSSPIPEEYYNMLINISSNGTLNWAKHFGKGEESYPQAMPISRTEDGGLLIAGRTFGTELFPETGMDQVLVVKMNPYGQFCFLEPYSPSHIWGDSWDWEPYDLNVVDMLVDDQGYARNFSMRERSASWMQENKMVNTTSDISWVQDWVNSYQFGEYPFIQDFYCEVCKEHYYGHGCNVTTCNGVFSNLTSLVCNGAGYCPDNDVCVCTNDDYELRGTNCEPLYCYDVQNSNSSVVCSGHGFCRGVDDCACDANWFGELCNVTVCGVIFSNDTSKSYCTGHGDCTAPHYCVCNEGYFNVTNSIECWWNCFDYFHDKDKVCSTHGDCISKDNCSCWENFSGDQCQDIDCFNITNTKVDLVCGGHGACTDVDLCVCLEGYSSPVKDQPCSSYFCGEFHKNDERACNGRGKCVARYDCDCEHGYEGSLCETFSCPIGGFPKDDVQTCSGSGKCIAPGKCDCDTGFVGNKCDENILYAAVMAPVLTVAGGSVAVIVVVVFLVVIFCALCVCLCLLGGFALACCGFVICLVCLCVLICCLAGVTCGLRFRVKKFGKLRNFDILLKEQEMEDDTSVAHVRINNALFEIPMDEIKLEKILGEGGSSSVVYLAKWKGQMVAFKCFKTRTICSTQMSFDEFEREVSVLGSISHPHIIRYYGSSLEAPRVGILMEFCPNGDLKDYISRLGGSTLNYEDKLRIIHETCLAMEYLHSRSIIHRDLKLENVLLDKNLGAKLMDFGLSKIVDRMSQAKTTRIGTGFYMAPEIVLGGHYSEKIDVYSVAMFIYILCTEALLPYGWENADRVEIRAASDPDFRPDLKKMQSSDAVSPAHQDWLCQLVETCWSAEPKDRMSMKDVCRQVESRRKEDTPMDSSEGEDCGGSVLRSFLSGSSDPAGVGDEKEEGIGSRVEEGPLVLELRRKIRELEEKVVELEGKSSHET